MRCYQIDGWTTNDTEFRSNINQINFSACADNNVKIAES